MKTIAFALLAAVAVAPEGTTYYIGHGDKFINIAFESDADVETIIGTTHAASGSMSVDLEKGSGEISIRVPVKTLRTGIDLRDEHLRGAMWLDAEKFPDISFTSKTSSLAPGKSDQILVTGDFEVHGQKKEVTVPVSYKAIPEAASKKAGFGDGKWVKFTTEFDVKLSDHGVKVPDGAGSKVSDTWKVKFTIYASSTKPK
jgi:polyisoprenoid-binding protein YceI